MGESVECLPKNGVNIKLFFNDDDSESGVITRMARELNADFSICQGKLEDFRGSILGSLVINVEAQDKIRVLGYLDDHHVLWEVL